MKKSFFITQLFVLTAILAFVFAMGNEVDRGERPFIDIYQVPTESMEAGLIWIKFHAEFAEHLDNIEIFGDEEERISFGLPVLDELNRHYAVNSVSKLFESPALKNEYSWRHRLWGFHLWYELRFESKEDIRDIVMAYRNLESVLSWAEPVYGKKLLFENENPVRWEPNDPQLGNQWHYNNTGQQSGTPGADISMFDAWDIEKGHSDVVVAIIDDGIQFNHPDLAGNMWSGIGFNFVDNNSTINPGNHGTHVAGTVAAVSNNNVGVAGVAGGSGDDDGVRLMSCQVFRGNSQGGFHLAPVYAADNDAAISQNSWGYGSSGVYNQPVLDAIDYFNLNGGGTVLSGGITIFAAGNDNSTGQYYPAFYEGAFSVAATNNQDQKAWYSTYDTWVDISAPGGETNQVTARGVLSTVTGSNYNYYQGTSMACPHAAGVAALIVSHAHRNDEMLSNLDVADILRNTTDDHYAVNPNYNGLLGTGRLNAYSALLEVQDILSGVVNPHSFTAIPLGTSEIELSWMRNSNNDEVMLVWSPDGEFGVPQDGTLYPANQSIPGGGTVLYRGGETSYLHVGLEETTTYYYRAFSYNTDVHYSSGRAAVATTTYEPFTLPFSENFDNSDSLPDLWEMIDYQGSGRDWQVGTISDGLTGTTGNYAHASGALFSNADTDLITPTLNLASHSEVTVSFSHYASVSWLGSFTATFSYSIDNGLNWTSVDSWSNTTANPSHFDQIVPAVSGESQVRFKWNFESTWSGHLWCIDDLEITGIYSDFAEPVNLTAVPGNEMVNLYWSAPDNVTPSGYNVFRDGAMINDETVMATEYEDSDVINDVTYSYYVTAVYDDGESGPSNIVEVTPCWLLPPQNLTVTAFHSLVMLTWEEPVVQDLVIIGYNVYRDEVLINDEPVTETDYEDSAVANDETYEYYVTTVYDEGESGSSDTVEATPYSLNPPLNPTAATQENVVYLIWEEPHPQGLDVLGYNVYRGEEIINPDLLTDTEYEDTDLEFDETYHYYVTALYDEGESEASDVIEITTEPLVLYPPDNLVYEVFDNSDVQLTWDTPESSAVALMKKVSSSQVPELLGYNVYRDSIMINNELIEETEYLDNQLPAGTYIYWITAVYSEGESEPSNQVEVEIYVNTEDLTANPLITELKGNYPNPFNPETTISFSLEQATYVAVEVFNIKGQKVATVVEGFKEAGFYKVIWDGKDSSGRSAGSGLYFYRMKTDNDFEMHKKMMLIK